MPMLIKITALFIMLSLVVFSILADMPVGRQLFKGLDLGGYLRLASLISLAIAAFLAWGYKCRAQASQKCRRANEALTRVEETVVRNQKTLEARRARLEASWAQKEQGLEEQIGRATAELKQRIKVLKRQNLELKETVNKLMRALRQERR